MVQGRWPLLGRWGWASIVGFALVAGFSAWLVLFKVGRQYESDLVHVFTTVRGTTNEAMRSLVSEYKMNVKAWASSSELRDNVAILLDEPRTRDQLLASPAQKRLRALLQPASQRRGYAGIFIIAPDYTSLASMRDTNLATRNLLADKEEKLLERVFKGEVLLSRPILSEVPLRDPHGQLASNQPTMFAAAPVRDESGEVIAALAFRIVPTLDFNRIARLGRVGETGDSYIFDRNGRFLSESRFRDQLYEVGLLKKGEFEFASLDVRDPGGNMLLGFRSDAPRKEQPLTRMAVAAVQGEAGVDVEGYRDYRGVSVVGSWTWDEEHGFGVATEMSRREAYRAFNNTLWLLLLGPLFAIVLVLGLLVVSANARAQALGLAEQRTVALRKSEQRYRSLVQTAGNIIVFLGPDRRILEFNDEAERIHGQVRTNALGKDYVDLCIPESFRDPFSDAIDSPDTSVRTFESPVLTSQGGEAIVLWNLTRLLDDEGNSLGTIGVGHDVTESKRAEERALLAERLAAIGEVSAGLAHESRNALARSQACLEMLARRVTDRPEAVELVERIQNAQRLLVHLYEEVRQYAAPIKLDRQPHDLQAIVNEIWGDLEIEREGRDITFQTDVQASDLCCDVDAMAIGQVFRNILENSLAACSDPVVIEVTWLEQEIGGESAVSTRFQNNGPPFTVEQRERIFEAFYTTKTRGTGLGMAISRRVAQAHGGRIAIDETTDRTEGVEIIITLPRREK